MENSNNDWMNNPKLQGIDPSKLQILREMADQGTGKTQNELLPFLMAATSSGKNKGMNFSADEISTIIEVIKMGKSPKEAARLDKIVNIMKMIH